MTASKIYAKTMKFVWVKLGLGLAVVVIDLLLLILIGFASNLVPNNAVIHLVLLVVWIAMINLVNFAVNHYLGYLVKAGHVAMVMTAASTGELPDNQFKEATEMVKSRFLTSSVYFVVDSLVKKAVRQLQSALDKVGEWGEALPGIKIIIGFAKILVSVALNCVDECCLAYTFHNKEQSVLKSAADGVVVYFQNWKKLLITAVKLSLVICALSTIIFLALYFPINAYGIHIGLGEASAYVATVTALLMALSLKTAFIDSYVMVKMVTEYTKVIKTTSIDVDLYAELCDMSKSFKSLFNKGQAEEPDIVPV